MPTLESPPTATLQKSELEFVDRIIAAQRGRPGSLLGILEKVQEHHPNKYLPLEMLKYIAAETDIPLAQIYSVVTFYALFNLEPQGKNTVCVCRGTACHTRGSRDLLEGLMLEMGLHGVGEDNADKIAVTTPDGKYTVRTVACFGQCALAPVVEVNHNIYGHMNEMALHRELEALDKEARKK
jgi:NADH-quinone oxidoreductase subunit E